MILVFLAESQARIPSRLILLLKRALTCLEGGSAGNAGIDDIIRPNEIAAMMNSYNKVAGYERALLEVRRRTRQGAHAWQSNPS